MEIDGKKYITSHFKQCYLICYIPYITHLICIYCTLSSTASLCNTCITSHFKLCHFVYIPYITHLICIYCTRYHLLHLAYAVLYHHSFIYLYVHILYPFTRVYKVVVLELLDYSLVIYYCIVGTRSTSISSHSH